MLKSLALLTLPALLLAQTPVLPDNYQINSDDTLSYIYSEAYQKILPQLKSYQAEILKQYSKEYGYELDDTLYVGLASEKNQIANGFSNQMPLNLQVFYGAGVGMVDYFCFDSWLKTLLIHETAHNFQLNPKENIGSELSHKIVGNTPLTFIGFFPLFPIPNVTESSFLFEGNAVMNESRFDNGGRLYSGYALAEVVTQAQAGLITPELIYNETLSFPYREKFYLVGGFFQQFLVERYGIKKVNGYFRTYSTQMLPLFSNTIFKEQYGKDFKTLLAEFVEELKSKHSHFKATHGEIISTAKGLEPMNSNAEEIYALVGDEYTPHQIMSFDKKTQKVSHNQGSWKRGEPFKIGAEYHTQTSAMTDPTQIVMGLFDRDGYLQKGSESKVIQGYLSDGRAVYFDLPNSLERPHIAIDGVFYDTANSSVHIDAQDNLYYFKQEGENRVLYKNKKALHQWSGHYGFVVDVDQAGAIYFITNSKDGSTAYRYADGSVEHLGLGDDLLDLKLINAKEALVTTITAHEFQYQKVKLHPTPAKIPATTLPTLADKSSTITQKSQDFKAQKPLKSEAYHPITELHYSSLDQSVAYIEEDGLLVNLNANFSDPLSQNSLSAILSYNSDRMVAGASYENEAHLINYGASLYGVDHYEADEEERNHGYSAHLSLPLIASGYWRASTDLSYTKAYNNIHRKPWTLSFDLKNIKQFGISKYPNHLNALSIFASHDRDNNSVGAKYSWMHDLFWQSYIGLSGSYIKAQKSQQGLEKGVRISDTTADIQSERTNVMMPTLEKTLYAKDIKMGELSLYKVFETPLYFYSFPLSLQRETLYLKQRRYEIGMNSQDLNYNETAFGIESDLLFFHKIPIPLTLEWLYNDRAKDDVQFRFLLGLGF